MGESFFEYLVSVGYDHGIENSAEPDTAMAIVTRMGASDSYVGSVRSLPERSFSIEVYYPLRYIEMVEDSGNMGLQLQKPFNLLPVPKRSIFNYVGLHILQSSVPEELKVAEIYERALLQVRGASAGIEVVDKMPEDGAIPTLDRR